MIKKLWDNYMYYFIIAFVSLLSLVVIPMIGLDQNVTPGWNLPKTSSEWTVWGITRGAIFIFTMLIFHCFVRAGKNNVRDNEVYKAADEAYRGHKTDKYKPRLPAKMYAQVYGKKGTMTALMSGCALVAIPQAILAYDIMALISYSLTIVSAIIFGLLTMRSQEEYWTKEFPDAVERLLKGEEIDE